jgi:DNA-binding winged helix-turn-helix (wHTH) protein
MTDGLRKNLQFGPFELSIRERVLRRDGVALPLGDRALDILSYLAERPGEVVAKRELMDHVWSDVTVEEGTIRVHVAAIRKALGDGQFGNRYIANIKGRGYSFVGAVVPFGGGTESRNAKFRHQRRLPVRPIMMIGREAVLSEVSHRLREERFGPGSIGKTTVALAVGRAAAEEFSGCGLGKPDRPASCCGSRRDILEICSQFERSQPGAGRPRSSAKASYHSR